MKCWIKTLYVAKTIKCTSFKIILACIIASEKELWHDNQTSEPQWYISRLKKKRMIHQYTKKVWYISIRRVRVCFVYINLSLEKLLWVMCCEMIVSYLVKITLRSSVSWQQKHLPEVESNIALNYVCCKTLFICKHKVSNVTLRTCVKTKELPLIRL